MTFFLFLSVLVHLPLVQQTSLFLLVSSDFLPLVCPFCKYPLPLLPIDKVPILLLTAHYASVFLSPALLTLQSFLIVKVLLPHSHLACPSLHSRCEPRAAPSPRRMPTSRAADSWSQAQARGAPSSIATQWTWAARTAPQVAPPEEDTTALWALDAPDSTVTQQRASTGSGALESWYPTEEGRGLVSGPNTAALLTACWRDRPDQPERGTAGLEVAWGSPPLCLKTV